MLLTLASSVIFLASSAAVTLPDPWDGLEKDLYDWISEDSLMEMETDAENQEEIFYSADSLFPSYDTEKTSSSQFSSSSESSLFVSIQVDGETIVLKDVPTKAWFAPFVTSMAMKSWMSGYRDSAGHVTGYFGPDDLVTVGQMVKVLVQAAGMDIASCTVTPNIYSAIDHWSASYVACGEREEWLLLNDASIDMDRPASRAEVVGTLLQALSVSPSDMQTSSFADVSASTPFSDAILQAQKSGVISGYRDVNGTLLNRFGPNDPVTRAEFAKIVVRGVAEYAQ